MVAKEMTCPMNLKAHQSRALEVNDQAIKPNFCCLDPSYKHVDPQHTLEVIQYPYTPHTVHNMGCYSDITLKPTSFYSHKTNLQRLQKHYKNTLRVKSYQRQDAKPTSEWF